MKLANHCLRAVVWEHSRQLNYLRARLLEFYQRAGRTGAQGLWGRAGLPSALASPGVAGAEIVFNPRVPALKPSCIGVSPWSTRPKNFLGRMSAVCGGPRTWAWVRDTGRESFTAWSRFLSNSTTRPGDLGLFFQFLCLFLFNLQEVKRWVKRFCFLFPKVLSRTGKIVELVWKLCTIFF